MSLGATLKFEILLIVRYVQTKRTYSCSSSSAESISTKLDHFHVKSALIIEQQTLAVRYEGVKKLA